MLATGLVVILLTYGSSPSAAHSAVESSNPTDGAVIDEPVVEITLVFIEPSEPLDEGFQVVESDGDRRPPTDWVTRDGRTFVLHFDPPITGGETGMQWSIRSADSHVVSGGFSFTVTASADETATTAEAAVPSDGVAAGADQAGDETDDAAVTRAPAPAESGSAASPPVATDQPTISSAPASITPAEGAGGVPPEGTIGMRAAAVVGRFASMAGSLVAIGALVFLVRVLRGGETEGRLVVTVARRAALIVAAGAVVEAASQVAIRSRDWMALFSPAEWVEALSTRFGGAVALHLIGAFGVATGSYFRREQVTPQSARTVRAGLTAVGVLAAGPRRPPPATGTEGVGSDDAGPSLGPPRFRWHLASTASGAALGAFALVAAAVIDGHTLSGPHPVWSALSASVHVVSGSVWLGGVLVLFLLLRGRLEAGRRLEAVDLAVRYSVLATVALVAVSMAGLVLTWAHVDSLSEIWTTTWGRLVLAKLSLVAVAASLGGVNHFVVIPSLVERTEDVGLGSRLKRLIAAEVVVIVAIVSMTALLVGAGT